MLKKILSLIICTAVLLCGLSSVCHSQGTYTNEKAVRYYFADGITMVSVRDFFNAYSGYKISWSSRDNSAVISGNSLNMQVWYNKGYSCANGRYLARYIENNAINGAIYAPVTVLAKAVGADVKYNANTMTVTVGKNNSAISSGEEFYNYEDLDYLSRIIEAESGVEPFFGKCAVGDVIRNRVNSSEFPNTIKDVIYDRKYGVQFTPVANSTINNKPGEESIIAAKCILDGFCISERVLYFLNPRLSVSHWIENNRVFAFSIGTHDFYY